MPTAFIQGMTSHHESADQSGPISLFGIFCRAYGLPDTHEGTLTCLGGGHRTPGKVWRFTSASGDYVMKPVCLTIDPGWETRIRYITEFAAFCREESLPVAELCVVPITSRNARAGECWMVVDGVVYCAFRYVLPSSLTPGLKIYSRLLGAFGARLHEATARFRPSVPPLTFSPTTHLARVARQLSIPMRDGEYVEASFRFPLERARLDYLESVRRALEVCGEEEDACRKAHVHGDLRPSNIVWTSQERFAVVDFDLCHFGPVVDELHNLIVGSDARKTLRFDPVHGDIVLKAYSGGSPCALTDGENRMARQVALARFGERFAATFADKLSPFFWRRDAQQIEARSMEYELLPRLVAWGESRR